MKFLGIALEHLYLSPAGAATVAAAPAAADARVSAEQVEKSFVAPGTAGGYNWDYQSVNRMWDAINTDFSNKYYKTKRRNELTWSTTLDNMSKANAFNNPRNKANKAVTAIRKSRGK